MILVGNVGQDPRVKYFDTGSAVATFPLATTDRGYTLANGTQIPDVYKRQGWSDITDGVTAGKYTSVTYAIDKNGDDPVGSVANGKFTVDMDHAKDLSLIHI